jgi:cell shape-determining protein MreC
MSAEMCQKLFSIYQGEYDKLKESLAEVEEQLQRLEAEALSEEQKRALLDKYKHIDELTALVVDEFIDTVYIGNYNEDGSRDITIKWKI